MATSVLQTPGNLSKFLSPSLTSFSHSIYQENQLGCTISVLLIPMKKNLSSIEFFQKLYLSNIDSLKLSKKDFTKDKFSSAKT